MHSIKLLTVMALTLAHSALAADALTVYDACKNEWIDTGLPYRANPSYDTASNRKPKQTFDRTYKIQGQKMRLYDVDIYSLEDHVRFDSPDLPQSLKGIWWMDGNPLPEVVLSFADSQFDRSAGVITNPYSGPNSYLFTSSLLGRAYWDATVALKILMKIRIPQEMNIENPSPGDKMFVDVRTLDVINISSEALPTTYINDQLWRRETLDHCYNLRKIVDAQGVKLPTYDLFVQKVRKQTEDLLGSNPDVLLQIRPE